MANVNGREVSDGSHNVIYKQAGAGAVAAVSVAVVTSGENVRYKIASSSDIPNVIVSFEGVQLLTVDSTAFTSDSTLITADQTEI